ncbi:uncharacterized protein Z519_12763 [Cladophialophora bantiana CBS 173.52]|uniref:Uncharacterized protein n=1 Tax=Cladophialophora bantiana (strain ATCC 10958 / CBS 173.52 / CDC B-1940 / NIH 8579) TaxID=1442370 RepID=A0A0D2H041_CLAB1|nr:uncharacterized protein Z519_12763 [Cladophialophora bantiana CBS 173.52]KIW86638.1 hypothetical protein Z519_12763 [Cladophialophora bantiana CBS 173.52]
MSARYPVVKCICLPLDQSSLAGARAAAKSVMHNAEVPYIDILVSNAGISRSEMNVKLCPDGFETHFVVNNLVPFLFINLVLRNTILAS